jgi:predicted enzyme related to lactoylglutathione lyase
VAPCPIVHLELHTPNLARGCGFFAQLCGWQLERVEVTSGVYQALQWGGEISGGVVECGASRPLWLPYVEVADIATATERARQLGAKVILSPREGPAGWRSVVKAVDAGELALWQQKPAA